MVLFSFCVFRRFYSRRHNQSVLNRVFAFIFLQTMFMFIVSKADETHIETVIKMRRRGEKQREQQTTIRICICLRIVNSIAVDGKQKSC